MVCDTSGAGSPRGWVLPSEPVAVRFLNTVWADQHGLHDDLGHADDLAAWLQTTGLLPAPGVRVGDDALQSARRLRDAARRIAAHATRDVRPVATPPPLDLTAAIRAVNAGAAHPSIPQLGLRQGGLVRNRAHATGPVGSALASLAAATVDLVTDPGLPPLLACRAPGCVLYFVRDHPRRAWCSAACGNRARVARHYQRHRTAAGNG